MRLASVGQGLLYEVIGEHIGVVRAWQLLLQDAAQHAGLDEDSLVEPQTVFLSDEKETQLLYKEFSSNLEWIGQDDLDIALAAIKESSTTSPTSSGSGPAPKFGGLTPAPADTASSSSGPNTELGGLTPAPDVEALSTDVAASSASGPVPARGSWTLALGVEASSTDFVASSSRPRLGGLTPADRWRHPGNPPPPPPGRPPPGSIGPPPPPAKKANPPHRAPQLRAIQIAEMLGNRQSWQPEKIALIHNVQRDGYVWIALSFDKVLTMGHARTVDGHISLAKIKPASPTLELFIARLTKLAGTIDKTAATQLEAHGSFHRELAQEHYAWVDLMVTCKLYAFCHKVTNQLDSHWRRPSFHASFRTWPDSA